MKISANTLCLLKAAKDNEDCFNQYSSKCSKVQANLMNKQGNLYEYKILGKNKNNCIIDAKLITVEESKPAELKQSLEGKSMKCSIPLEELKTEKINEMEKLEENCTGQLKEALLQITIDQLYEIVVKNIGSIALQLNQTKS